MSSDRRRSLGAGVVKACKAGSDQSRQPRRSLLQVRRLRALNQLVPGAAVHSVELRDHQPDEPSPTARRAVSTAPVMGRIGGRQKPAVSIPPASALVACDLSSRGSAAQHGDGASLVLFLDEGSKVRRRRAHQAALEAAAPTGVPCPHPPTATRWCLILPEAVAWAC